jgi:hypothetical protein
VLVSPKEEDWECTKCYTEMVPEEGCDKASQIKIEKWQSPYLLENKIFAVEAK